MSVVQDEQSALITLTGQGLNLSKLQLIAQGCPVRLTDDPDTLRKVQRSVDFLHRLVENGQPIYGVNTSFGAMGTHRISGSDAAELQSNLLWAHKAGAGARLEKGDVRAAIATRINALLNGVSGIRLEVITRLKDLLNHDMIPHVFEHGSIGASGDLVPLSYIAGSAIGLSDKFKVDLRGQSMGAASALKLLGLDPIKLRHKEGLALINGTSVMAAIAGRNSQHSWDLLRLSLATHALMAQALGANSQSFAPFTHQHKPHPGQSWSAAQMCGLLDGSRLCFQGQIHQKTENNPFQDRYSLRCLPQFMGPSVEALQQGKKQLEIELNSATDNPLIDSEGELVYHGGNFLGQYVASTMDTMRLHLGLMAKHLDVQISLLVAPEYSQGLPPSLVGNTARPINVGLKALQLCANSIMPLIAFHGHSLADRFPPYAEQFNQNINSQGFGSAMLGRRSITLFRTYLASALLFATQAVELKAKQGQNHFDPSRLLSPRTQILYQTIKAIIGQQPSKDNPTIFDDGEGPIDHLIAQLEEDLSSHGRLINSLGTDEWSYRASN